MNVGSWNISLCKEVSQVAAMVRPYVLTPKPAYPIPKVYPHRSFSTLTRVDHLETNFWQPAMWTDADFQLCWLLALSKEETKPDETSSQHKGAP